jgi:predicted ester cyclase
VSQVEDNKQVAEDFFLKAINEQNFDVLARILSPMYTYNGDPSSLEANKEWIIGLHSTYPGLDFSIEDILAEDDKVALRWRMTAPAAGPRPAGWSTGTNIAHVEDGQLVSNFQNGQVSDSWTPAPAAKS